MRKLVMATVLASFALSFPGIALAEDTDTLVLKGSKDGERGARFDGKVIEEHDGTIVFEYLVGTSLVRSTFSRSDVVFLSKSGKTPVAKATTTARTRKGDHSTTQRPP